MTVRLRFAALVALLVALAVTVALLGLPDPGTFAAALRAPAAPVLAVLASAVLVAGLVPRTWLAAAAGLLFGPLAGGVYILLGATLGALVAFGVGRWLGRDFVALQRRVARLDRWLTDRGVLGVVLVRMLPVAPFGLVSYALGTSGVRPPAYLVGTVAGMLPGTVVYVNLGANASEPGSTGFWLSVAAAVLLWVTTVSAATWLARRRSSQMAGVASGS